MPYGQVLVDTVKDSLNNILAPASAVFRNRIINGAMVINQRATSVTDSGYVVDRFGYAASQPSKATVSQDTSVYPTGFTASLKSVSSSAYTVLTGDYFFLYQPIEGYNIADLGWGTANAKTVTLSFQAYSSLTGTFGGSLRGSSGGRSYPFTYTISSANTWTTISVTVAGDTSGTWDKTNGNGLQVNFGLGVGSTFSGTAGAWAGTNYLSATGATSVVGTSGATFYITGVQLEVGTNATSFDYRPYGTELQLCNRYYQLYNFYIGISISTTQLGVPITHFQPMRATPSITAAASIQIGNGLANFNQSSAGAGISSNSFNGGQYILTNFTGLTVGTVYMANQSYFTLSAEL